MYRLSFAFSSSSLRHCSASCTFHTSRGPARRQRTPHLQRATTPCFNSADLYRPRAKCWVSQQPGYTSESEPSIAELREQLMQAIDDEDYARAAELRDEIQMKEADGRRAVEEANLKFYTAFQAGNMKEMREIWGHGDAVQVIHPGLECIAGREEVLQSWSMVLGAGRNRITLEDVRVVVSGDTAFVTCVEVIEAGDSRGRIIATNIFIREKRKWKMVHHHGSPGSMYDR